MVNNIRFCKQRDRFSCGPIALLNADKFFGLKVTYRHLPAYRLMLKCESVHGTKTACMSKMLGRASRRSWKNTEMFLQGCKGCLIIQTGDGRGERKGHFSLICRDSLGDYYLINHFNKQQYTAIQVKVDHIQKYWKEAYRVWYINKLTYEWRE